MALPFTLILKILLSHSCLSLKKPYQKKEEKNKLKKKKRLERDLNQAPLGYEAETFDRTHYCSVARIRIANRQTHRQTDTHTQDNCISKIFQRFH